MNIKENKLQLVKFASKNKDGFFDTLKSRVDQYFAETGTSQNGNLKMLPKTLIMLAMYTIPFVVLLSGIASSPLIWYGLWMLMGIGMVGIGCGVMHDSNHGTYSDNKRLNSFMGKIIVLVGGYDVNWRIQHNILHHTYTNIEGLDHDLDAGIWLRFSPFQKKYFMHRYQHIYGWFLYGMLTMQWATIKDFKQAISYGKLGLLKKEKISLKKALIQISVYKLVYFAALIALPILITAMPWYHVVLGFLAMHFVSGFLLSVIFQLAHVMEDCEFPEPPQSNKMDNSWAIHQLLNTADFSPKSGMMNWFVGGLNHQIEHHLFPHISHVHYRKIAPIVRSTAQEFGLPYYVQPNFASALFYHGKMLKTLGRS